MTTLKDIFNKVTFEEILEEILNAYPDEEDMSDQYEEVFSKIMDMELAPNDEKWKLVLENTEEEWDCFDEDTGETEHIIENYVTVYGKKARSKEYYAIEFAPWNEWLSMIIDTKTLKEFTPAQIAAYCLWEMTFISFDEENIEDALEDLKNVAEGLADVFGDSELKTNKMISSDGMRQYLLDKWEEYKNKLLDKLDRKDEEE